MGLKKLSDLSKEELISVIQCNIELANMDNEVECAACGSIFDPTALYYICDKCSKLNEKFYEKEGEIRWVTERKI